MSKEERTTQANEATPQQADAQPATRKGKKSQKGQEGAQRLSLEELRSTPIDLENFETTTVQMFGQDYTLGEPTIQELCELADLVGKPKADVGEDEELENAAMEIDRNTAEYYDAVLSEHISPSIDIYSVPGRFAPGVVYLVQTWEKWSGARSFLNQREQQLQDQTDSEKESQA